MQVLRDAGDPGSSGGGGGGKWDPKGRRGGTKGEISSISLALKNGESIRGSVTLYYVGLQGWKLKGGEKFVPTTFFFPFT